MENINTELKKEKEWVIISREPICCESCGCKTSAYKIIIHDFIDNKTQALEICNSRNTHKDTDYPPCFVVSVHSLQDVLNGDY